MKDFVFERTTTAIAVGAGLTPVWLPTLREASEAAGLLLPILGCTWLIIQVIFKLMKW